MTTCTGTAIISSVTSIPEHRREGNEARPALEKTLDSRTGQGRRKARGLLLFRALSSLGYGCPLPPCHWQLSRAPSWAITLVFHFPYISKHTSLSICYQLSHIRHTKKFSSFSSLGNRQSCIRHDTALTVPGSGQLRVGGFLSPVLPPGLLDNSERLSTR